MSTTNRYTTTRYEYNGEQLTIRELAALPHINIKYETLRKRLQKGKMSVIDAIRPVAYLQHREIGAMYGQLTVMKELQDYNYLCQCSCGNMKVVNHYLLTDLTYGTKSCGCLQVKNLRAKYKFYSYNGEQKTISQWSLDDRCIISYSQLKWRLQHNWPIADALTTPSLIAPIDTPGTAILETENGTIGIGRKSRLYRIWQRIHKNSTIWTSSNSYNDFRDWSIQSGYDGTNYIIKNSTLFDPDESIWVDIHQLHALLPKRQSVIYTYRGLTHTLWDWSQHKLCCVRYNTLSWRLYIGWQFADALTVPESIGHFDARNMHYANPTGDAANIKLSAKNKKERLQLREAKLKLDMEELKQYYLQNKDKNKAAKEARLEFVAQKLRRAEKQQQFADRMSGYKMYNTNDKQKDGKHRKEARRR